MMKLTVLGCGSAILTSRRFCSSQVLDVDGGLYMIDCGEATQMQFFSNRLKQSRLNNILISHLHGDHCLGLIGFVSSLALLNRKNPLNIFGPADTEKVFGPLLNCFCSSIPFEVRFITVSVTDKALIYEDNRTRIYAFPLQHRVECYGYLFEEQPKERHIIPECIAKYEIPFGLIPDIKHGKDFTTLDGEVIANELITTPPEPSRRFAYCSDTSVSADAEKAVAGVDLLYHETTFMKEEQQLADDMFHSTAADVAHLACRAKVGRLLIGHFSSRHADDVSYLHEVKPIFPDVIAATPNLQVII